MTPDGGDPQAALVSTDWLEGHLSDAQICIVDIRGKVLPPGSSPRYLAKRSDYTEGHIPGAVFVDWTRDIVDPDDPVPMQVSGASAFAETMASLGIGDDTLVIAYDDYNHIFAGRLAWALRYYGHERVRILDGGWPRWVAESRPTSPEPSHRARVPFTARPNAWLRRTAEQVADHLATNMLLVDARPPDQFAGRVSAASRSGHIPGARNVHYAKLIDPATGKFLPPQELTRVFSESGIDVDKLPPEVVVYCNGGVSCTVPLEALRILGRSDVAVYDGSWNEWGNDSTRPIDGPTGPAR